MFSTNSSNVNSDKRTKSCWVKSRLYSECSCFLLIQAITEHASSIETFLSPTILWINAVDATRREPAGTPKEAFLKSNVTVKNVAIPALLSCTTELHACSEKMSEQQNSSLNKTTSRSLIGPQACALGDAQSCLSMASYGQKNNLSPWFLPSELLLWQGIPPLSSPCSFCSTFVTAQLDHCFAHACVAFLSL